MIKLNIPELLEKRQKNYYWLYRELGMSYENFTRMINNETRSIRYTTIDSLCGILECTPGDLFVYQEEE